MLSDRAEEEMVRAQERVDEDPAGPEDPTRVSEEELLRRFDELVRRPSGFGVLGGLIWSVEFVVWSLESLESVRK